MKTVHVSYSRFASYLKCPYQHFLSYIERIEPRKPARPLTFGTDFHALLEARLDGSKAIRKTMRGIREAYYALEPRFQGELGPNYPEDIATVFTDYLALYADDKLPSQAEIPFELEVVRGKDISIVFVGRIDEIYRRKDAQGKFLRLGEHKTFSRRPDMDTLIMNSQKCLYAMACRLIVGMLPRQVIWDYIASTPAATPIWLERGQRLSTAKNAKITPFSWRRACIEHGIEDPKIIKLGDAYADNLENFYFRQKMDIQPQMVDDVWDSFLYTAQDIADRGEKNRTKNLTKDCSWCKYKDICKAELTGDTNLLKYTREKDFRPKPERSYEAAQETVLE